ncbi:MAG: glycosyltransferase family 2 protein [Clostridia bacterium]|nr:glycosyltransferase family 2 protein [Clostridia bacterium]
MNKLPILYIVIPCYNEEEVLPLTAPMFKAELELLIEKNKINENSKILFVNDGSKDKTWDIICRLSNSDKHFLGISLSRNKGHQKALLAGLLDSKDKCDITISIDCDGQDDITVMEDMVDAYLDGCEVVYGVRSERSSDSFFKRFTAQTFYKLLRSLGGEIVYNHADYRLIGSRALEELSKYREAEIFLRGIIPMVGFKSTSVYYKRTERISGKSHYPMSKMLSLAVEGITGLSVKPIRFITFFGFFVSFLSLIGIMWAIVESILGKTFPGWASTTCIVCFFSGVQLLSLGIIGEYIGKIFLEVKHRPRYCISERTENTDTKQNDTE